MLQQEPIIEENGGVADKAESKTEPKVTGLTALTGFTLPDENPLLASLPTVNDATELDNDEEQAGNEEEGEVKTKEVDFKRDGVLTKVCLYSSTRHTRARTHTHTRAHVRTHAHTHTHTCRQL